MQPNPALPSHDPRMSVVYRPLDQLKPDPTNARSHSHKQIRQIARSIETFGFNVPILVDAELKVIAGHGRLLAGLVSDGEPLMTRTPTRSSRTLHCAVYTRKSSEEGLEQEFNSLHAQREACEAFIRSQRHQGRPQELRLLQCLRGGGKVETLRAGRGR
jgi:hypothetical protein